jgi:uncharacterized membrane protein
MNARLAKPGIDRSRRALSLFFIGAGINHFALPRPYEHIVPPGMGDPAKLVAISGIAEIAGGVGVLLPPTRRAAGWGLMALLIAVFPANIYMALAPEKIPGARKIPRVLLWLRLPLQPLMIWWVWASTKEGASPVASG